jgi:putative flippase GtrA
MKLGRDFAAYNLVAVAAAATDWLVFVALRAAGASLLECQVSARLSGGLLSFWVNRRALQDGHGHVLVQGRRFLLLYAFSMGLSVVLLYLQVHSMDMRVVHAKVIADATCFVVNFLVMRGYVFRATTGLTDRLRRALGAA